ncbi:unnamed protein product [Parascedosporium putredinis]|uniref:DUF1996 domain-containing protein n=1 Tax=Parascedosporium putredinis TaxID=1442378 RepID=A0A9P1H383_9PEZI|nr:unnamed protein product [Parascedosporium putredinis]CAI7996789.1 unnamed protein product [Parascedosporium putredinis]
MDPSDIWREFESARSSAEYHLDEYLRYLAQSCPAIDGETCRALPKYSLDAARISVHHLRLAFEEDIGLVDDESRNVLKKSRFNFLNLVNPGVVGSPHLHQIVGGNSFNPTMDPSDDPAEQSTCTTCTFADDFSNYWTAVMFFRARNGTYKRVRQQGVVFHEDAREGGITVYYIPPDANLGRVTGFQRASACAPVTRRRARQRMRRNFSILTILASGTHVSWPLEGDIDTGGVCPETHPVVIPRVVLEIQWDTREFNDLDGWPEDGSQPFTWSFGDDVGYGSHGDYIFGWKGDALQRAMDDVECGNLVCGLPQQGILEANKCMQDRMVTEDIDDWLDTLPGLTSEDSHHEHGDAPSRCAKSRNRRRDY